MHIWYIYDTHIQIIYTQISYAPNKKKSNAHLLQHLESPLNLKQFLIKLSLSLSLFLSPTNTRRCKQRRKEICTWYIYDTYISYTYYMCMIYMMKKKKEKTLTCMSARSAPTKKKRFFSSIKRKKIKTSPAWVLGAPLQRKKRVFSSKKKEKKSKPHLHRC